MIAMIFAFLAALALAAIAYHFMQRIPQLQSFLGDWGSANNDDPRIAAAAMMYAVATEDGALTADEERHILLQLTSTVGLEPEMARTCLTGGKRMARRLRGDLNSRLHQLMGPIARKCSVQEKEDVLDMLRAVAGDRAEQLGPVRDGLARLSSSLLHEG